MYNLIYYKTTVDLGTIVVDTANKIQNGTGEKVKVGGCEEYEGTSS